MVDDTRKSQGLLCGDETDMVWNISGRDDSRT